jgi:uncharacterized membrane protein
MLGRWMDGPGHRLCIVVKIFQKDKSKKYAVLEVKDETGETVCFQTTVVRRYSEEYSLKGELVDPYLARPVYADKNQAIKYCKNKLIEENKV